MFRCDNADVYGLGLVSMLALGLGLGLCADAEGICGNGSVSRLSKLLSISIVDWTTETFFFRGFAVLNFDWARGFTVSVGVSVRARVKVRPRLLT